MLPIRKARKAWDAPAGAREQATDLLLFCGGIYMQDFISVIQSVGFPIAVAIAMFIMLQQEQKQHKEESQQIRDALTEQKVAFSDAIHNQEARTTEAINNNTLVMQRLLDKLEEK